MEITELKGEGITGGQGSGETISAESKAILRALNKLSTACSMLSVYSLFLFFRTGGGRLPENETQDEQAHLA
jgi:hypothetical protein